MDWKPLAVAMIAITLAACGQQEEAAPEEAAELTDETGALMEESQPPTPGTEDSAVQETEEAPAEPEGDAMAAAEDTGQAGTQPGDETMEDAAQTSEQAEAGDAGTEGDLATGESIYQANCLACHGTGAAGAPKLGDTENWAPRIDKGMEVLYTHAIEGYQGESGYMPPKGGFTNLSDEEVKAAVQYMVAQSR